MCVCKCELPLCKTSLSVIASNIIIVSAHKMTHTQKMACILVTANGVLTNVLMSFGRVHEVRWGCYK